MGVPEKQALPTTVVARPAPTPVPSSKRIKLSLLIAIVCLVQFPVHWYYHPSSRPFNWSTKYDDDAYLSKSSSICAQADAIQPSLDVKSMMEGKEVKIREWLQGAVKVPTEIYDVMGPVGEDNRYDIFFELADYMEKAFPLVHKHLTRTRVVTHALVFEWFGSDPSLKPLLLTGHQDVVPVLPETRGLWHHDPYGGEYDEETGNIWGRGASDDKSGTIGILSAIELLLESGQFKPTRTVIVSLGIDEETGGKVGATNLGIWIEAKYGKDSIAMLVDEGAGMSDTWGQLYATPAVGEKGYLDVEILVETLGGHSSVPPPNTGIGFTAMVIAALEKHPHPTHLNPESPLVALTSCWADASPEIPKKLKKSVRKVQDSLSAKKVDKEALKEVEDWFVSGSVKDGTLPPNLGRAMVSTTQAIDIIGGGLKVNALPEVVRTVINHRISVASSWQELQKEISSVVAPIAADNDLALHAWGKDVDLSSFTSGAASKGKITLSEAFNSSLNPAVVSPHTIDSPSWRLLSGTVKGVYATRADAGFDGGSDDVWMAPGLSTGNTDTKRYWNLTRDIYRFAYQYFPEGHAYKTTGLRKNTNAHTVDEYMPAATFVEEVRWFMSFILNVDESREV